MGGFGVQTQAIHVSCHPHTTLHYLSRGKLGQAPLLQHNPAGIPTANIYIRFILNDQAAQSPQSHTFWPVFLDLLLLHCLEQQLGHLLAATVGDGLHGRLEVHGLRQQQLRSAQQRQHRNDSTAAEAAAQVQAIKRHRTCGSHYLTYATKANGDYIAGQHSHQAAASHCC